MDSATRDSRSAARRSRPAGSNGTRRRSARRASAANAKSSHGRHALRDEKTTVEPKRNARRAGDRQRDRTREEHDGRDLEGEGEDLENSDTS